MQPSPICVDQGILDDLKARLIATRWAAGWEPAGWDLGTDRATLQALCEHWITGFDWRAVEDELNQWPAFVETIDGEPIHFFHIPSREPDALPLLLTHGWPGSVYEFHQVIGPLVDPAAHGGDPRDAFHVVCPSLPGYGWSGPTHGPGWHVERIAQAFQTLMHRLGYDRYGAQGGDWGSMVTLHLANLDRPHVAGIHINLFNFGPPESSDPGDLTETERQYLVRRQHMVETGSGYSAIARTRPATLAAGLHDSPVGLASWILDKFHAWSDCGDDVLTSFTPDQLLANITTYWVTGTIGSSVRLYFETTKAGNARPTAYIDVPTGCAVFPKEPLLAPRSWTEAACNVQQWTELPRGGHFAAFEVPDLFVDDVRRFFRTVR